MAGLSMVRYCLSVVHPNAMLMYVPFWAGCRPRRDWRKEGMGGEKSDKQRAS
jgi:hypothetical protein